MRAELQRLHKELGTTIIYVTHDQTEALTMSTKIALFKAGELNQVATPTELYNNPIDLKRRTSSAIPASTCWTARPRLSTASWWLRAIWAATPSRRAPYQ